MRRKERDRTARGEPGIERIAAQSQSVDESEWNLVFMYTLCVCAYMVLCIVLAGIQWFGPKHMELILCQK